MKAPHQSLLLTAVAIVTAAGSTLGLTDEVLRVPLPGSAPKVENSFRSQPLAFEENVGQVEPEVRFLTRGPGYQLFLTGTEAVMLLSEARHRDADLRVGNSGPLENARNEAEGGGGRVEGAPAGTTPHVLRMRLKGGASVPSIREEEPLRGKVNYFIGNDPCHWRTNISTFAKVHYREVYPDTDLVYYGNEGRLEYDFVLAPGANPDRIAFQLEGADRIELDPRGDLTTWVAGRPVRWQKPVVYQECNGQRIEIAGAYRLRNDSLTYEPKGEDVIGFELAAYDRTRPLVIDPVLVYSTYLGGTIEDGASAIAADGQGNVYITGRTTSLNFPTKAALKSTLSGGSDVFVSKLSPAGELLYSTYLGGGGDNQNSERGAGLAVDSSGTCYVVGQTASTKFPMVNAIQAVPGGKGDGFVAVLKPDGSALVFSSYLGGSDTESITRVALDPVGNIYVGGQTFSTNFPVVSPIQGQLTGGCDWFVTKLDRTGTNIVYSTYLGGSGNDFPSALVADGEGNAYVAGYSWDFPVWNAYQPLMAGNSDIVYAKIVPDGSELVYCSYFGGGEREDQPCLALAHDGTFFITGHSWSSDLATPGAYQTTAGGWMNILARFNASDGSLLAATYLDPGIPNSLVLDADGNVIIGGPAYANPPLVNPLQPYVAGNADCFIAKFSPDLSTVLFSTYLGGSGNDGISTIALDPHGDLVVCGEVSSTNFPTVNAFQPKFGGGSGDSFVAKISFSEELKVSRSGQSLALSWPTTSTAYQLESANTPISSALWEKVNTAPVVVGNDQVVTVPIEAASRFFRLRKL